jgi:hypothetical protein
MDEWMNWVVVNCLGGRLNESVHGLLNGMSLCHAAVG